MSSSLSICRTLNLREKSFPVPRSSETATAWSVAAIGLVSLRKIFLPTKFSYPKFRGSGPRSSTRSIPTARPGPAQLNRFPINKTADRGQEDCMGRNISQAAGRRDQNPSILPPKGGTTHSKKSVSEKFSYQQNFPTPHSCGVSRRNQKTDTSFSRDKSEVNLVGPGGAWSGFREEREDRVAPWQRVVVAGWIC